MEYIINPWWFYLASALDSLHIIAVLVAIFVALSFVILVIFYFEHEDDYGYDKTYTSRMLRTAKKIVIAFNICVTLIVIVPSETTSTKMMIANTLTMENIKGGASFTQDQIGQIIDKIADAAIKVKQAENSNKT